MSAYMTDEEKVELIKKWWNLHGSKILMVVSIVMLCIAGFRYWHWQQEKVLSQSSKRYEQLMMAVSSHDKAGIQAAANALVKKYPKTVYADAAYLSLASTFVNENKLSKAKDALKTVITQSKRTNYQQLAEIRMARIELAEKSYEQALASLNHIKPGPFAAMIEEVRGDVYAQMGAFQKAVHAYKTALGSQGLNNGAQLYLEMKINAAAAKTDKMRA